MCSHFSTIRTMLQLWTLCFILGTSRTAVTAHSALNQCFISANQQNLTFSFKKATSEHEETANRTQTLHLENHHHLHPALHQVKHRAQEKATIGIAQHVTENLVSKSSVLTKNPQWWKRGADQISAIFERFPRNGGKRLLERTGELLLTGHGAERVTERGAGRLVKKGIETSAEKGSERILERGVEQLAERSFERAVERGVEGTLERGAERLAEQGAERIAERGIERLFEGSAERITERGTDRILQKGAERFVEGKAGRIAERGTKGLAERNGERFAEHLMERSGERSLWRLEERFAERLLPKLGRSLSLTLPALGALFGWYLFQQDLKRMNKEPKRRTKVLFGAAALTDFIDILLHVWIVYALWSHLGHSSMIVAEKMSMACAVGSTVSAVLGEIICSPQSQTTDSRSTMA